MKAVILPVRTRFLSFFILALFAVTAVQAQQAIIIDHTCTSIDVVPTQYVIQARQQLRLSYGHTSHGSQIVTGMTWLRSLPSSEFTFSNDGSDGSLSLHDRVPGGDLGHTGSLTWEQNTRALLERGDCNRNVIMWSWCGGCSDNTVSGMDTYLNAMDQLEQDYPDVTFIYMTGHLDGSGLEGNLHQRNEQIRDFCRVNEKVLFDFADIESYDPDGNEFLSLFANDACYYNDAQGQRRNWADEWCDRNPGKCANCSCAHSKCINCQQKGKAFWWMMARLVGWDGSPTDVGQRETALPLSPVLDQNYPNPFNPETTIRYSLPLRSTVSLTVYNVFGSAVATVIDTETRDAGMHSTRFNAAHLPSGIYYYALDVNGIRAMRSMLLLK